MKTTAKKRMPLLLPILWVNLVLLLGVLGYGLVRYLLLAKDSVGFQSDLFLRILWETVPALVVLLATGIALAVVYAVRIVKPVKALAGSVSELAKRVESGAVPQKIEAEGCLSALSEKIAGQEKQLALLLKTSSERTAHSTEENIRRLAADTVHRGAIPDLSFGGLTYGVSAKVKRSGVFGADFVDAFLPDRNRIFFAVGDVWGNGLEGALRASLLKNLLREQLLSSRSLSQAISAVNSVLLKEKHLAVSLFAGIFAPDSGELRFVCAGQHAPLILGEKLGFLRVNPAPPLGIFEDFSAQEEFFVLQPGQGLFLYTDGLIHARNRQGERFGYDRLLKTLQAHYENAMSADAIVEGVWGGAEAYADNFEDDCSMLALYYPNGIQRLFRPELGEIDALKALLSEWLGEDPRLKRICMACEEIFTNIVNHAGAKSIQLGCEKGETNLVLRFTNDGEPFDPLHSSEERDMFSYGEGVMAMNVIRQLAGEVFYRMKQNLNVLTIRFPVIKGL